MPSSRAGKDRGQQNSTAGSPAGSVCDLRKWLQWRFLVNFSLPVLVLLFRTGGCKAAVEDGRKYSICTQLRILGLDVNRSKKLRLLCEGLCNFCNIEPYTVT